MSDVFGDFMISEVTEKNAELSKLREENKALKRLAEWTLIDAEHLPKVGDEVLSESKWAVSAVTPTDVKWAAAGIWYKNTSTHYRPINAPKEPA